MDRSLDYRNKLHARLIRSLPERGAQLSCLSIFLSVPAGAKTQIPQVGFDAKPYMPTNPSIRCMNARHIHYSTHALHYFRMPEKAASPSPLASERCLCQPMSWSIPCTLRTRTPPSSPTHNITPPLLCVLVRVLLPFTEVVRSIKMHSEESLFSIYFLAMRVRSFFWAPNISLHSVER